MNKPTFTIFLSLVLFPLFFANAAFAQDTYTKLCLQAIESEKAGNLDEAISKYTDAINSKPSDWTGYCYRGKVYLYIKKFDKALTDISKAITLSPNTSSLYSVRGDCYYGEGIYDKAINDYTTALSNKGNKLDKQLLYLTYYNRGQVYFRTSQYQSAIDDFNQAIGLANDAHQNVTTIHSWRAMAYMNTKNFPEVINDFDIYLAANPNDLSGLFYQGFAYMKNGETEKARANASRLLEADPTHEVFFSGSRMMEIYNLDTRRIKSKQLVNEANTLIAEEKSASSKVLANMKLADAFKNLDTAWLYAPDISAEEKDLKDSILNDIFRVYPQLKTKPEISEFVRKYAVQASGATKERKYDEAIGLWSKVLKISPFYPMAYYNRALLLALKEDYRSSILDMQNYLNLLPEASDARTAKDKIYEWEGKLKETPVAQTQEAHHQYEAINTILSPKYSAGNFHFAMGFGGSLGLQFDKNSSLGDYWSQEKPSNVNQKYSGDIPLLYSGDIEIICKPLKRFGFGAFGKWTGGIGTKADVSGTKYILNMGCFQYGGLARFYFMVNDLQKKPDLYFQYALGQTSLNGYYGVATMSGIVYNYSYLKNLSGNGPYNSFGVGMGGKISKHGYLTLSLDYLSSKIDEITYEVTTGEKSGEEKNGTLKNNSDNSNITATYKGVVLKFLFGFCF